MTAGSMITGIAKRHLILLFAALLLAGVIAMGAAQRTEASSVVALERLISLLPTRVTSVLPGGELITWAASYSADPPCVLRAAPLIHTPPNGRPGIVYLLTGYPLPGSVFTGEALNNFWYTNIDFRIVNTKRLVVTLVNDATRPPPLSVAPRLAFSEFVFKIPFASRHDLNTALNLMHKLAEECRSQPQ